MEKKSILSQGRIWKWGEEKKWGGVLGISKILRGRKGWVGDLGVVLGWVRAVLSCLNFEF